MVAEHRLTGIEDLTPELWWDYVDYSLAAGIKPVTVNGELRDLDHFLHFLEDQGRAICQRMLRVESLAEGTHLPRDVPMDQLRRLPAEIEAEAAATNARNRRMGILDRAWFLLMLHSGLRTGEVRRLQKADLDLKGGRARIEQSKGPRDRVVYLSPATVAAIEAYLDVRGPGGLSIADRGQSRRAAR
jgi:integrase